MTLTRILLIKKINVFFVGGIPLSGGVPGT